MNRALCILGDVLGTIFVGLLLAAILSYGVLKAAGVLP